MFSRDQAGGDDMAPGLDWQTLAGLAGLGWAGRHWLGWQAMTGLAGIGLAGKDIDPL